MTKRQELIERARDMAPTLRARGLEAEQLRRCPDATIQAFQEAGFFKILHPKKYGGFELPPSVFYEVCMEIGRGCGSSAWVLGIVGVHNWQLPLFDPRAAADVWKDDNNVLISSSYAPTGKAVPVTGGFRVSGRWSFSTGCDHCSWVFLGATVTQPNGSNDLVTFLIPIGDYRIDDNWHVSGLSGSGSKDIVVEDAFVPTYRTHSLVGAFRIQNPGAEAFPQPLYKYPFGQAFTNALSAPVIGAARGMIELFCEQTKGRKNVLVSENVYAKDPFMQMRIAEADSMVRGARLRLLDNFARMEAIIASGGALPLELRAQARWDAAYSSVMGVRTADLIMEAAGGRALNINNPLQRMFRDVHAMRAHGANTPEPPGKNYGGLMLGQQNAEIFL
jgi:3-hydroxy-9,10-secoandrosta-1,3,5(10)-triene-9,17-dione monooxygenase